MTAHVAARAERLIAPAWTRVRDVNGFARWRQPRADGPWGHILANHTGIIVAVAGRVFCASTDAELEAGMVRLFERLDWDVYRAAVPPIMEAWSHVERQVAA